MWQKMKLTACLLSWLVVAVLSLSTTTTRSEKKLFPYQQQGIDRLIHDKRLLLGDEMGLGKTVQCIGALNRLFQEDITANDAKILVICPKSVLGVWQDELDQWLDHEVTVNVASSKKKELLNDIQDATITLINYDVCYKHRDLLQSIPWDVLICDEAHYLKSIATKRTRAILGDDKEHSGIIATYLWLLTGTPMMNRPVELYPLLRALQPRDYDSFDDFCNRYCDPDTKMYTGRGGRPRYVKDLSGSRNLSELSKRLEPIMLRRYKADVLSQLPPKFRSCLCLSNNDNVADMERQRLQEVLQSRMGSSLEFEKFGADASSLSHYLKQVKGDMTDNEIMGLMATIRKETALRKLEPAVELLKEVIVDHKVVVFCHHRQLIESLMQVFKRKAVHVIGGMDTESRAVAVKKFQTNDKVRLFVGSIRSAGVGLTLTAASHVIFLDLDWSPAVMAQAEDRLHRVGQQDSVHVQYYVFKDTIDEWIARSLVRKQMDIDQVLLANTTTSDSSDAYVFDFGKYKEMRLEDVPRAYLQFVATTPDIWEKRPSLWRALHRQGLVHASPPMEETKEKTPPRAKSEKQVDFIFDFGKHNGEKWNEAPSNYRDWIIREGVWKNRPALGKALSDAGIVNLEA